MQLKNGEALILQNPKNVYYFTQFWGSFGVALITNQHKLLFTDGRYAEEAKKSTDFEVVTTSKPLEELPKFNIKKAHIEYSYMTLSSFEKLKKALPTTDFENADNYIREKREVKTPKEIESIRMAANIANIAFKHQNPYGKTEKQFALDLEFAMKKLGASDLSFETIIASAENASKPHAQVTSRIIETDAYTICDFGAIYNHYCSDMTRTFRMGEPSAQMQEVFEIVKSAKELGLSAVKAGVLASDIDKICRDYIASNGYGDNFMHSTGHGVGLDIHESPSISKDSKDALKENMIITVEPGIYLPGIGGVRIEDMVRVTANGYENFSLN